MAQQSNGPREAAQAAPEERAAAIVEAQAEAAEKQIDTTVPGGKYEVNGVLVDCNGEPLKDQK
jgi:hypothetical protein